MAWLTDSAVYGGDYCDTETFRAECARDEVIVMRLFLFHFISSSLFSPSPTHCFCFNYIRQVNGVKLADILYSLLSVCLSICLCVRALSPVFNSVCPSHNALAISLMQPISLSNPSSPQTHLGGYMHPLSAF